MSRVKHLRRWRDVLADPKMGARWVIVWKRSGDKLKNRNRVRVFLALRSKQSAQNAWEVFRLQEVRKPRFFLRYIPGSFPCPLNQEIGSENSEAVVMIHKEEGASSAPLFDPRREIMPEFM